MTVSIEERVKQIIDFIKDFQADTFSIIELIMLLEEEFKLEILDDEIPSIFDVKTAISFVKDNINREPTYATLVK